MPQRFGYTVLALLVSACPASADLADEFKRTLSAYFVLPEIKALALAEDSSDTAAWGFSFGEKTADEAATVALDRCQAEKSKYGVKADCVVVLLGNSRIVGGADGASLDPAVGEASAPLPPVPEPAAFSAPLQGPQTVSHSTQWVNGTEFQVGVLVDLQVWVAYKAAGQPSAMVYVVNGSDHSITFTPASIVITPVSARAARSTTGTMRTFSAEEYEKKVRNRQAWQAALYGAATALANQPQPTTSTVRGSSSTRATAWGPGGWASAQGHGTYWGTITTWPSAQDYAAANARTNAQVAAMTSQLSQSFQAMAATLARTHTLAPQSFYGGIVYFQKHRADQYTLTVPFDGEEFRFIFGR
jgi:hypothetical protein